MKLMSNELVLRGHRAIGSALFGRLAGNIAAGGAMVHVRLVQACRENCKINQRRVASGPSVNGFVRWWWWCVVLSLSLGTF